MTKTAVISARIDPELKATAERVFQELGLNTTQAITLFFQAGGATARPAI